MKRFIKELINILIAISFGIAVGFSLVYAFDKETVIDDLAIKEYINP